MIINSVLEELLAVKGLKRKNLITRLGMTPSAFRRHELNGFKTMMATQITKMAWILGVPFGFLSRINDYDKIEEAEWKQ